MNTQYKILFPVDFSDCSSQLVDDVMAFIEKFEAEIHLIYVVRAFGYYSSIYVNADAIQEIEESVMNGAKRSLEEFKNQHFPDRITVFQTILHGDAAEEIIRYATIYHINLIIMGTHGRKALEKFFLGSVAQRVVQGSPVPVLTINPYLRSQPVEIDD